MADIVEVTYCKDCKFYRRKQSWPDEIIGQCEMHKGMYMFGYDFCSYGKEGKRREQYTGQQVDEATDQTV